MTVKNRIIRFFILTIIGLSLGAGVAGLSIILDQSSAQKGTIESVSIPMAAPSIGGAFTLIHHDGKTVTDKDFAGKYLLIYFGFASCPAICPTELQKMTEAYRALPKKWQERIQPIFISVDPERDTPEVLKNYVGLFMPELIGLTGSVEQINDVKKTYKVYAAKVPEGDTYTMDHSSFIYYMGLSGQPLAMYKTSDTAETMAKQIPTFDGLD